MARAEPADVVRRPTRGCAAPPRRSGGPRRAPRRRSARPRARAASVAGEHVGEEEVVDDPRAARSLGHPPLHVHPLGGEVEPEVRVAPEPDAGRDRTVARGRGVLRPAVVHRDAVLARVDLAVQARVHERHVVALAVVVGVGLPVRVDRVHEPVAVRERLDRLVGAPRRRGCRARRRATDRRRRGGRRRSRATRRPRPARGRTRPGRGRRRSRAPAAAGRRVRRPSRGSRTRARRRDPAAAVQSGPARWRHTLWNARSVAVVVDDDQHAPARDVVGDEVARLAAGGRGTRRAATPRRTRRDARPRTSRRRGTRRPAAWRPVGGCPSAPEPTDRTAHLRSVRERRPTMHAARRPGRSGAPEGWPAPTAQERG